MALAQNRIFTMEDIYNLPEGERAELIDGQIYMMAPPSRRHQEIIGSLYRKIADYIDMKRGACKVYLAPFAVFLNNNNVNYVEPDISIICDKNKLDDKGCNGAPDWIIEIVSPSSKRMDYYIKLFKYRTAGVREYWIVDPIREMILVYDFENDDYEQYSFSEIVKVRIYDDFKINFTTIQKIRGITHEIKMVDIARHLGVSKATVSLAVNGKPGVNEETRRMVLECLEEMKKNNGVIPVKREYRYNVWPSGESDDQNSDC